MTSKFPVNSQFLLENEGRRGSKAHYGKLQLQSNRRFCQVLKGAVVVTLCQNEADVKCQMDIDSSNWFSLLVLRLNSGGNLHWKLYFCLIFAEDRANCSFIGLILSWSNISELEKVHGTCSKEIASDVQKMMFEFNKIHENAWALAHLPASFSFHATMCETNNFNHEFLGTFAIFHKIKELRCNKPNSPQH